MYLKVWCTYFFILLCDHEHIDVLTCMYSGQTSMSVWCFILVPSILFLNQNLLLCSDFSDLVTLDSHWTPGMLLQSPGLGLQICDTMFELYVGSGNPNRAPHACMESIFCTSCHPNPHLLQFMIHWLKFTEAYMKISLKKLDHWTRCVIMGQFPVRCEIRPLYDSVVPPSTPTVSADKDSWLTLGRYN